MAKKKKSKRNDARGYSTTTSTKSKSKSTKNENKSSTKKVIINSKTHHDITNLLSQINTTNNDSSIITTASASAAAVREDVKEHPGHVVEDIHSRKFLQKMTNIYDNCINYGFNDDQIVLMIHSIVNEKKNTLLTLESALDWLCVHLRAEDLPSMFTEADDVIIHSNTLTSGISVIKADPKLASSKRQTTNDIEIGSTFEHIQKSSVKTNINTINNDDEKEKKAQKSWLLEQYAYEIDDHHDHHDHHDNTHLTNDINNQNETTTELSPEEIQLAKLTTQLSIIEADLNDDVANYMRSKFETNDLKKQKKILEGNIRRLKGKLQKAKSKIAQTNDNPNMDNTNTNTNETSNKVNSQENLQHDINDIEEEPSLFSFFDEDEEEDQVEQPLQPNPQPLENQTTKVKMLLVPKDAIPKNWTGKTPYKVLQEHCQKHKISQPKYQKISNTRHGCEVTLSQTKLYGQIHIENNGPFDSFKDSQHYLATQVLYKMNPKLPLYLLFPPFFSNLWKSWLHQEKQIQEEQILNAKELKVKKMNDLIKSLSMTSVNQNVNDDEFIKEKNLTPNTNNNIDLPNMDGSWDEDSDDDKYTSNETYYPNNRNKNTSNGTRLHQNFYETIQSKRYQDMLTQRKKLPMYLYRDNLLSSIQENVVTVLCGETGCGKTTQCAQYILEHALQNNQADQINILCTQPRRVAAMSVAERVAEEMVINGGKVGSLVGYHIRMESKKSDSTKLLFCTTGVILRRLQDDPHLKGVTHVIVDEVHERQWQIDFLLIALRKLIQTTRKDLKILLMSATLDAKLFCNFFHNAPFLSVPGRTFPVSNYYLEDLIDATNHIIEEDSQYAIQRNEYTSNTSSVYISGRGGTRRKEMLSFDTSDVSDDVSNDYVGYKMSTRRSMDRVDERVINYDLIEDVLVLLLMNKDQNKALISPMEEENSDSEDFGATLIFLPGLGEIRTLRDRLKGSRSFAGPNFDIIVLHSTLSSEDQRKAFKPAKQGCRKIILATNIAETSITIPDVTCVIDTGQVREVRQNERTSTATLVTDWCSKASAKQRAGRAGRVRPGICCKLFSSRTANRVMKDQSIPELQRVPLDEVCLSILAGRLSSNCLDFLSQAPQPPSEESVNKALLLLKEVGAIEMDNNDSTFDIRKIDKLTPLGYHLAKLPVHVKVGKMLIFGCLFHCLDKVLTIAATLSSKSPFSNHIDNASQASAAHRTFLHPNSDFLTLCNVWEAYRNATEEGNAHARNFCSKKYLNRNALLEINDARRQFLDLLRQIGFVKSENKVITTDTLHKSTYNKNSKHENLLNAVICAGFYPNIAHVDHENAGGPILWHRKERVYFHSSSVNHNKKELASDWILFHEKFATSRVFVSVTSVIKPFSLLLFGGNITVKHVERKVLVDDWIELGTAAKTGVMFRQLRQELSVLLKNQINNCGDGNRLEADKIINIIVDIFSNE